MVLFPHLPHPDSRGTANSPGKPICIKQTGVVTSKVSDKLCAGAPMDLCACKCYHEAQWTCEGDSVVCKAKFAEGELQTVGDKVFELFDLIDS